MAEETSKPPVVPDGSKPPPRKGLGRDGGGGRRMPPIGQLKGRPLGRILIKMGKLSRTQVGEALELQKTKHGPIGQILVELGYVDDNDVRLALGAQAGMEPVDISKFDIPTEIISLVPSQVATTYRVVPLDYEASTKLLTIALDDPSNFQATDDLKTLMGFQVRACITTPDDMSAAQARYYPEDKAESITDLITEIAGDEDLSKFEGRNESIDLDELKELADSNPVKRLLNLVLLQAIRDKASDIHFEPFEDEYKMRYRIDGVLYEMMPPPRHIAVAIASRIKVMANLNIAERRMPQDGRIELAVAGNPVDLRVAVLPTMFGESVVMRVLDRGNVSLSLERLGMRDEQLGIFRQLINKPNGIIINTGPTGSGKTTTLYAALNDLNTIDTKILTAEDPVEYDIDGLIQCQINTELGMTFGKALRSFLRQDPDIILVGEIRDLETAQIAVQASLTGHLVFTTLHTNDAPSSIARLVDLGLEPFLITATLEAIVAQRLVRRICENCKDEFHPTEDMLMELDLRPEEAGGKSFMYGRGCDYCNNTGYRGRLGLFEIMVMNDELRDLVMKHASTALLRDSAKKAGLRSLRENGLMAIFEGLTTIEEVVRETILEEV
ncbi:MAG TPA: ATPase, T2SS/T4P/T4SS family [Phycisphaerae bacterium]|nr:ATPase, T2SS/T4P/T4SS family [Phycisphaerae bacterium]HRY69865.1 ATPase, T2SS/T4P/T4SS family [Phycisphaerae bacterium]HSA25408.1 ATPase, T2SS/T4P/T4SS family [Phycisphaerae bacterium]